MATLDYMYSNKTLTDKPGYVHFADPQSMDYHDGLPKWTTTMDYPKLLTLKKKDF